MERKRTRKTFVVSVTHSLGYTAPSIYVENVREPELAVMIAKRQSGLSRFPDWRFSHQKTITNEIK